MKPPIDRTEDEWRALLTPEQYRITREKGTERAFTGEYHNCHDSGAYRCACCGAELFSSETKYDSGSGWPSFWAPLENVVDTTTDHAYGMVRTEVHCARCKGHLGHVFEDGPRPTGLRYCMNGISLEFDPK